jgi:signal peptidase II
MFLVLTLAAIAFLFDQITKCAVQARLGVPLGGRLVQFREVHHRERLYSSTGFRVALIVIWSAAAFASVWLHSSGRFFQSGAALTGMGCALGGAAGNLLDILRRRSVLDFIDLGWWPVFNLADVAIVGGLLLAFGAMVAGV